MSTSASEIRQALAKEVKVARDELRVVLSDGRTIAAPLAWYPRLLHGTSEERGKWRLIGGGAGISWEALDEDISVEGLLAGVPSGESQKSLKKWQNGRKEGITNKDRSRAAAPYPIVERARSIGTLYRK